MCVCVCVCVCVHALAFVIMDNIPHLNVHYVHYACAALSSTGQAGALQTPITMKTCTGQHI